MPLIYATSAIFVIIIIRGVIKAVKEKKWRDVFFSLFFLPWVVWMTASFKYGGTAFNDAALTYSAYQAGHYYLRNGSVFTEVSYEIFQRMKILQIVGMASWAVVFGWAAVAEIRRRNTEPYKPRLEQELRS